MANSKFGYVRQFETHDVILPQCYIVVRIDGKKFHEFSKFYEFAKPNDENALKLMNACAKNLVLKYKNDIILAFGESDEYSFILKSSTTLFNRRKDKLATLFGSFSRPITSHYGPSFSQKSR
ncbi:CPS_collapsed_G0020960.mRNA.1.CDS.1 [Saccharomyces cerevisiae]|nr:CPS_collapsed_G0020960.mRNA.1.CDS.1 [Saccharomyces cerevisiae]